MAGYIMGITSEHKLVVQLICDIAFRRFVGQGMQGEAWDASRRSQNRRRRPDHSAFTDASFGRHVESYVAARNRRKTKVHCRVGIRKPTMCYQLLELDRKELDELFGKAKGNRGPSRVRRRFFDRARQGVLLTAIILEYKRPAALGAQA